jgi:iron only hydrogenase large subunit-like protein
MFGALVKTYWAEKMSIHPDKIFSVSIMPCTAKKYEAVRPEMTDSDYSDVDMVLTTREIVRLLQMTGINPLKLKETALTLGWVNNRFCSIVRSQRRSHGGSPADRL